MNDRLEKLKDIDACIKDGLLEERGVNDKGERIIGFTKKGANYLGEVIDNEKM